MISVGAGWIWVTPWFLKNTYYALLGNPLLKKAYYVKIRKNLNKPHQGPIRMPHMRLRHLTRKIQALMRFSPIVGIPGYRQVGKTTLMESLVNQYLTFDDEDTLIAAQNSPKNFLQALKSAGIGIDECQLCEKIFPALKEHVRNNKRPSQYLLSGSR